MQASCPQCANRIVIDDAKVPDRPFAVRCPKCQTAVRFPGKQAAAAAPPEEPAPEAPAAPHAGIDDLRAQMMAQLRREMALGGEGSHAGERALVALPDRGQAGALTLSLTRLGYAVETLENAEQGARLLEQGAYGVVVTAPGTAARGDSLYQRICRLGGEARRKLFLVLVADNARSGDGTQAWTAQADLVLAARDSGNADAILRATLDERQRLYQTYLDVRSKHELMTG